jgi:mitochondrial inner membrane protein COX18
VGVHNATGLSWALALPLTAVSLRLFVTLPLAIYQRRAHQRRVALQPLRSAWQAVIRKTAMEKSRHLGPAIVVREVQRRMTRKTFELYRRWKCGLWREWLQILYFPVWLAVIEAIRGMCGAKRGLLGLLADGAGDVVPVIKTSAVPTQTVVQSAPEGFLEVGQAAIPTANAQSESAANVTFEPSMVTEGMLWFPDLTVADPLHILPFALSATLLLNIYSMGRVGLPSGKEPLWRKRLKRILLTVALAAGPLTLEVPCAMLLYWISSGVVGYVHNLLLDIWMPLQNSIRPCKPVVRSPKQTKY